MLTRWDEWYADDNLSRDERILAAPASQCARRAAKEFLRRGTRRILDLGCGVGRDSFHLGKEGLAPIGVDASLNGLRAAYQGKLARRARAEFVVADARCLPFESGSFEGVYCFGLLHEFTDANKTEDVARVIAEVRRLLPDGGLFVLATLAGKPEDGLPAVQLFTRPMFEQVMAGWKVLEIKSYADIGCTNRPDYPILSGKFEK
jgi:SAM-dependent methyltransferase